MDKIMQRQRLKSVLTQAHIVEMADPKALVLTIEQLLNQNVSRDDLLVVLDDLRHGLDESSENMVLDVMDRLEGNCPPEARL